MTFSTVGDLALSMTFLRHSGALKSSIDRLTGELASGTVADIHGRLGGNHAYLTDIDTRLTALDSYAIVAGEAAGTAAVLQASLDRLHDLATTLGETLLTGGTGTVGPGDALGSGKARQDLEAMVSVLNGSSAGRQLFSGTAVTQTPLEGAGQILDGLRTALAGETDPDALRDLARDWFGPGGGFETAIYRGAAEDIPPVRISESRTADLGLRADDPAFRTLLRETALAALADDPLLGLDAATAERLREGAATALVGAGDDLVRLQGALGFQQAHIEEASVQTAAARLGLEETRGRLLAADPYETAARLEDAQFRLEALFKVTARSASLSLVNLL